MTVRQRLLTSIALLALVCAGHAEDPAAAPEHPPMSAAERATPLKQAFEKQFQIGTALNRSMTTGVAFRRSSEDVEKDIQNVQRHFNHVVAENDMKWQLIHPRPGADGYDFEPADAFVEFGTTNGMSIAGHTLVWHSQTPNWVFEGTHVAVVEPKDPTSDAEAEPAQRNDASNTTTPAQPNLTVAADRPRRPGGFRGFDLNGPRASREELLERMREHIHTVVGRYKGQVRVWDVVNEAIADEGPDVLRRSPWSVIIGPDFVARAFEYAHEADPDAVLRYNDYGLENPAKRRKLIALIKSLQEQNVPVMAIGSQAHCNVSTTFEDMDQALAEMATLGLPIHITELDVNSAVWGQRGTGADIEANQQATDGGLVSDADLQLARAYEGLFRAFVKHHESIEVVTFWGVNDAVSWRSRGRPLLFDGNNEPKPAFDFVVRVAQGQ
ncbi:MAG: endo-1,4-beta-xylanase [Planctomyces sp.]|nr:endo-1,4-beta-xylanase [Planctomyces sp.]